MHAVSVGRGPLSLAVKAAIKAVTPERLRRDQMARLKQRLVYKAPSAPDERVMNQVRRRYAHEVHALSEYIGRDLVKLWGYDGLT